MTGVSTRRVALRKGRGSITPAGTETRIWSYEVANLAAKSSDDVAAAKLCWRQSHRLR